MDSHTDLILSIGIIFFLGLASDILGRKTLVPRVTFLIIIGILIGPSGTDLLPQVLTKEWFHTITTLALGMIGFLLGQQFTWRAIKRSGSVIFSIALGKVLVSFILIAIVLVLVGIPYQAALILASIGTATAPAAVYEIVHDLGIHNRFSTTLLAVVALDDILAMLLFSLVLALLSAIELHSFAVMFSSGFTEIFGSLLIGYLLGYPIAKITGRVQKGEPSMVEALGSVFLICGISQWLELSTILAAMAMGSAVSTFATHHTRPFHAIENIQGVFMILFFILAGASLEVSALASMGIIGAVYIIARLAGLYTGARLGAQISQADKLTSKWMGIALSPQAGVAIGMALIASQRYEAYSHIILPLILGTTVVFEIIGPMMTSHALKRTQYEFKRH